ncbi:unnamed protein product, partial [Porites lobata]
SRGSDDLIPKEIAAKVSRWLQRNNVPQKYFAEKVLNRSQGSFSDYLTKAPPTMPKSHGRGIWQRLQDFLESEEQQKELREQFREGGKAKKQKAVLHDEDGEEADTPCRKRKKYSDLELSTLDTVFLSSGGTPDKGVVQRTANALKIDEQQVIVWFNNHRRKRKEGSYLPGQYSKN